MAFIQTFLELPAAGHWTIFSPERR